MVSIRIGVSPILLPYRWMVNSPLVIGQFLPQLQLTVPDVVAVLPGERAHVQFDIVKEISDMPVLLSFTMNTTSPNSSEAIHSPDIGRTSVDMGGIGVVGVEVGVKIGVSVGAGVGTGVSSTVGVTSPEIGVVGVEVGVKIGVSVGAGVGTGVSSTVGVRAGADVSSSTHPENITIATITTMTTLNP